MYKHKEYRAIKELFRAISLEAEFGFLWDLTFETRKGQAVFTLLLEDCSSEELQKGYESMKICRKLARMGFYLKSNY